MAKINKTSAAAEQTAAENGQRYETGWLSADNLEQVFSDIDEMLKLLKLDMQTEALTPAERRRLLGSGVRRYGFIDKTSDVAEAYPDYAPAFFNNTVLKRKIREIELLRNISVAAQQILRMTDDVLLQVSDEAFQLALGYYNTVKEAARRRQPGAEAVFRMLQPFFHRSRHTSGEPTENEVERDVRALLHGKKDGKIVIENQRPHMTGGKHVVVDETHKAHAAWKETESGEIDE